MIQRIQHVAAVQRLLRRYPVVAILGARQIGKTTLARQVLEDRPGKSTHFDLEDHRDLARLDEPTLALDPLRGLVVLDEIQHRPELFATLRVLADRPRTPARFLVLGSASPDLLRQGAETLAGRIAFHELGGLDLEEVDAKHLERLWQRGGFPRSYLARSHQESHEWRMNFSRTFLERDLPRLGITIRSSILSRFWTMLAHYHGQIWNGAEFARAFGVSAPTVRHYLDLLTGAYMIRQLPAWAENIGKRVVKSPKVYIADSGILHALLGLATPRDVMRHPKVGASWEGFLLEAVIRRLRVNREACYSWSTHAGAELDLLVVHGRKRLGFEFKRTDAPKLTKSMAVALDDLRLDQLHVIHAGRESFPLARRVAATAAADILKVLRPLK